MELKDAIVQICKDRGIDPATILKRGKPSQEAKNIRAEAEAMISGKSTQPQKREVTTKEINPLRQAKPQVINTNAKPTFTEADEVEFQEWWNSLSDSLKRFFVR